MRGYDDFITDGEAMQTGWKRTGDIAAKGPWARRWAILRRSAEIWRCFSSFYLKERRINRKLSSGAWTRERRAARGGPLAFWNHRRRRVME